MDTNEEYPLVSAIMLAGRVTIADILTTIECFQAQTYPYKELIIVNNAKNQYLASALEIPINKDVFLIDTPTEYSAGMARNYGISAANGRILAHFDADYWHTPSRLSAQIATMANERAHISVLANVLQYSFISGEARVYNNAQNAVLGTLVFSRPAKIDYPDVEHNEEYEILQRMMQSGMRPIAMAKPDLACKLILTHGERIYEPRNRGLTDEQLAIIQTMIKSHLIYHKAV